MVSPTFRVSLPTSIKKIISTDTHPNANLISDLEKPSLRLCFQAFSKPQLITSTVIQMMTVNIYLAITSMGCL